VGGLNHLSNTQRRWWRLRILELISQEGIRRHLISKCPEPHRIWGYDLTGYAFEHEAHVGIRQRYLNFVLQPTHTHTQDKTEDILLLNMFVIATCRT